MYLIAGRVLRGDVLYVCSDLGNEKPEAVNLGPTLPVFTAKG